jgi:protein SCO1
MRENVLARIARTGAVAIWTLCALGACTGRSAAASRFFASDITGVMPDLRFVLESRGHRMMQASDLRGNIVLMYFGYTHCPDACPMTLTHAAQVVQSLGPIAHQVRVLFVSMDPKRDSPERLASYLAPMGSQFIGLTGTDAQLNEMVRRYRVVSGHGPSDVDGNYVVYHSTGVFVFDKAGRARLLVKPSETVTQLTLDLRRLVG